MKSQLRPAIVTLVMLTLITGVIYPMLVTGIAQAFFPRRANGSAIMRDGRSVGSELIGQSFTDLRYFWPRPSATSPVPYAAQSGAGSNLAPSNPAQIDAMNQRAATLRAGNPDAAVPIPIDLLTASASGLDPHISAEAAEYQIPRVADARHLPESRVRELVAQHTQDRTLGVLGEPRVNVLLLNLALDEQSAPAATSARTH